MADILKITTPLVQKTPAQPNRHDATDPMAAFDLQDVAKVIKPGNESQLQQQNNGMVGQEQTPSILMDLLKDPSVTVNFLKNIFLLQEIIKLLPVNNQTFTQEIEQLFNSLLVKPEEIVEELLRQENTSTTFKGELFDFLRQVVTENPEPEMRYAIANLLKSINCATGKQDVLDAVANSLQFLSESTETSKTLSSQLQELSDLFRQPDAAENFRELKADVLMLLKDVESSILFTPKMEKVVSILYYNLSRFNDNPDFFQESVSSLMTLLDGRQKRSRFLNYIKSFWEQQDLPQSKKQGSRVMDVLAKIIGKQSEDPSITLLNSEKIEKIIHSLLSSPCNFTPLLHFVVPVEYMDIKSFAELWIDPDDEEGKKEGQDQKNVHMLVVFDIEGIGQFEVELYVKDETIDLQLFCPPAYLGAFSDMPERLMRCTQGLTYQFGSIKMHKLKRPRSLMEVFKSLPRKRTGVDVKV